MGTWNVSRMESPILLLLLTFFTSCYCNYVPVVNMSLVKLREDLLPGAFAFQIEAYDLDNDPLTYKIEKDNGHFNVIENTGAVFIKKQLDREDVYLLPILVIVSDGIDAPTEQPVNILVLDANDNAPRFINSPYNIEVQEDTALNTKLLTVTATDPDDGLAGTVTYSINHVIPTEGLGVFSIQPALGDIVLTEPLNFTHKSTFYQLLIVATDGGGPLYDKDHYVQSSNATAFITVIDVPNIDPQFLNLPNLVSVNEHSPVTTSVFKVQARDPDTGINDVIRYSIEDTNAPDLFQIDVNSGVVTVKTDIDREALLDIGITVVDLTVKATEANLNVDGVYASTMALLQIQINDINDHGPLFYKCEEEAVCTEESSFTGEVDEHSSVGLSITGLNMRVKDKDAGENSRFQLRLEGPDKDAFSVSPVDDQSDRAVLILVKHPLAVDYETKKIMHVQVVAQDAGVAEFVSTATVTITVNDINDNIPQFNEGMYELSVFEHCDNGTIVGTVTATDEDELDDGLLTYRLLPVSMLPFFDVYTDNGTIYVKNGDLLDRERRNLYSPTLQATDSGGNPGSTVLEITILDINDQTPQFFRDYEIFIRENNQLELQVEARDDDEPNTLNSKIQYTIMPSEYSANFTIDKDTGLIKNNGILDREAIDLSLNGVIVFNVTASDMGVPSLSSSVKVTINVDDENDNKPVYLKTEYTFHVKESERGITVGFVHAHDADQTEYNNRISFRITSGSAGSFLCMSEPNSEGDGYQGKITVDPDVELDYESNVRSYNLVVEATDLGNNKAECKVLVVVVDVNDTPPVFPADAVESVEENSPPLMEVGQIHGSDVDSNHSLVYELVSLDCHCNNTWGTCQENWFFLTPTGMIMTEEGVTIDYEKCDVVKMNARVVDIYTEKGRNSTDGVVTIRILDMNDNDPEFIPLQDFFVLIAETVDEDKIVARVYAKDIDTGENKKIIFSVELVEFVSASSENKPGEIVSDIFKAETEPEDEWGNYKGVIKAKRTLEIDEKGKYLVTVMAKNGERSKNEILELITVDKSYKVGLRFESPADEVNNNLPNIKLALMGATKATVHVVKVAPESTDNTQRNDKAEKKVLTLLEVYFVFPNGTALDSDSVGRILNSEEVYQEYGIILQQYGLTGILGTTNPQRENNVLLFVMIGLVAGLVIVLAVTTTSLVCIRKKYKTKLKAAKAMNTAALEATEKQKDGPVVPGTNKYTRDGANPVLNLNIDSTTDLGFDEEGSNAERESISSLDFNIDMRTTENDMMPMKTMEEGEDDDSSSIEPLGAALAQRGKKVIIDSPSLTFTNPSADTTDL
ncbi:cadherin-related family member 2 [Trichomycterus rosablanca]|uniref:cadherin-related family member 2 n=1 Tax=Trichomycterus rosablanca TaxID=2290929 RepID=UPI002F356DEF